MRNTLIAVSIMAVFGAGTVLAATPAVEQQKTQMKRGIEKLDKNSDGFIDRAEFMNTTKQEEHFNRLDTNKDGKLSKDELEAKRKQRGDRRDGKYGPGMGFHGPHKDMMLDTDKDGRISKTEAAANPRFAERFDQMDVNKDGYIDKADREVRMKKHAEDCFAKADTDKNGQLSMAEFTASREVCRPARPHMMPRPGVKQPSATTPAST